MTSVKNDNSPGMVTVEEGARSSRGSAWLLVPLVLVAFGGAVLAGRWLQTRSANLGTATSVADSRAANAGHGQRGALLFQVHCAKCHGPEGHGDGESAVTMRGPPRDFAARPWRFSPTPAVIQQVIVEGIPGTAMPAAGNSLSEGDISALTQHVLRLSQLAPAADSVGANDGELAVWRDAGFERIEPRRDAPPLALEDAIERKVSLADVRGSVVIVNFWGGSCEHCLVNMPKLRKLEQQFAGRGLSVLSICADADDARQAQELVDRVASGHVSYCDLTGLASQRYQVQVLPTVWIIDREGRLAGKGTGGQDWTRPEFVQLVGDLLQE